MRSQQLEQSVIVPHSFYARYGKRAIDVVISGLLLLVTLPINIILAFGTFVDVGKPIFFRQERIGRFGKKFVLVKFRNMTNKTDEKGEPLPPELRVTKFGQFVRKTSLDELLNFWPIFKGDMSIIGPRPLLVEYYDLWNAKHLRRLDVKPGLECPTPRKLDHPISWEEQFDNDVWYAENVSFKTDLKLFFRLVSIVFDSQQRSVRASGNKGYFIGYLDGKVATEFDVPDWRDKKVFFPASEYHSRNDIKKSNEGF